jgi:hypothetical protein
MLHFCTSISLRRKHTISGVHIVKLEEFLYELQEIEAEVFIMQLLAFDVLPVVRRHLHLSSVTPSFEYFAHQ